MELISGFELYVLLKLDVIVAVSGTIFALGTVLLFISMIEKTYFSKKHFNSIVSILISLLLIAMLTPTTKQAATIIVLPAIINNERLQTIPPKVLDLLDLSLDKIKEGIIGEENE